jgi:branched-chain amino acid transport system substrate-binding protein
MKIARSARVVAAVAAVALMATGCAKSLDDTGTAASPAASAAASGAASAAGGATETIKVGFVTPLTGPLAAFGEADQWVVDSMGAWFAENPIQAGGKSYNVEILLKDSQSDPKRAGEVTGELINTDGVDVVMAHATPETTVPVSDQCEANATPCITADTPWQPWFFGRNGDPAKGFNWTYHFFWGLEDVAAVYSDMWKQVDSNKKVAALFPNDSDGQAWSSEEQGFPALVKADGFTIDNPGLFPSGTQDFSAQISQFKKNDDQLLMGVLTPPDFAAFWQQAKQQGFNPKLATIGKAVEFPAAIEGLGDLAQNLATEVWWTPTYPYSSSLTGMSSAELAQAYTDATGKQWNMPLGFSESLFEVLAAAVTAAGGPDKQAIADAMKTLQVSTVVGNLDWATGPVPNVAKTPLTGGQWRKSDGGQFPLEMVIVSNSVAPEVPLGGKVEPLN